MVRVNRYHQGTVGFLAALRVGSLFGYPDGLVGWGSFVLVHALIHGWDGGEGSSGGGGGGSDGGEVGGDGCCEGWRIKDQMM